jgi:glycosyltransferase involved in cell wall biosynthesis
MIKPRLQAAVEFCARKKLARCVFVVPFPISEAEALALHGQTCCVSMILRNPDPGLCAHSSYEWLGCFADDGVSWQMPGNMGTFVFLGAPTLLTKEMLRQIRAANGRFVVCESAPGKFSKIPIYRFQLWDLGERAILRLSNAPMHSGVGRFVGVARRVPGARTVWRRLFRPASGGPTVSRLGRGPHSSDSADLNLGFFRALLVAATAFAERTEHSPVPGRIILVNAGLAAGGAERQVVNTLLGLKSRGHEDVLLLCEYLHKSAGLDFYLPRLEAAGIPAIPVGVDLDAAPPSSLPEELLRALGRLPNAMGDEILTLVDELRARRPSVIHGWQDSTSIKTAIAAVIAGVPRIVLGSRNVIPTNFAYYQGYMRAAYCAIAEVPNVYFLNNSAAGAADYCRWLELPRERFHVVRNGVDFGALCRVDDAVARRYRQSLGIGADAPVVGSIFRFWAEKRPLLWLETARLVARQRPDVHFLLVGEGPMRPAMEVFIGEAGLRGRVHMPGARADIALPLSAMSAFLLTSEFEGTPNVVLEAQWLGLPVVATDAGGTRESIAAGLTGWCCDRATADELSSCLLRVLGDATFQASCRVAGPAHIEREFGMEAMIDATLNLYGNDDQAARADAGALQRAGGGK